MSQKVILIFKDGEEIRVPLNKDRLLVGREKGCDIVLTNAAVSRRHAAIIHKFGSVYIENVSSTGSITRGGEAVEYAEMLDGEDFHIGPFTLHWRLEDSLAPVEAGSPEAVADESPAPEASEAPAHLNAEAPPAEVNAEVAPEIPAENGESNDDGNLNLAADDFEPNSQFAIVAADEKTKVATGAVKPLLKVLKGEPTQREIQLENGFSWIVGRSAKCHIQIDNQKISRQHFKIIKIGNSFRVEDMGSANGTRVNGVAVTDSPLHPFDTVQAGPVEIQFLMASSSLQPGAASAAAAAHSGTPAALALMDFSETEQAAGHEKTQFAPPAVYSGAQQQQHAFASGESAIPQPNATVSSGPAKPSTGGEKVSLKERFDRGVVWFQSQPKQKKILYGSAGAVLLLALILSLAPNDKAQNVAVVAPPQRTPASEELEKSNAANSPDISPAFKMLSAEKQNEIRELYAKAERAHTAKDWKTAFEASKSVLDVVKPYKRAAEILAEAQTYLNEENLGNISKTFNNVEDAVRENEEKMNLLFASGDKALDEGRWDDAREAFSKAYALDPKSDRARNGLAASEARNKNAKVELPKEVPVDPDAAAKQAARDEIDGLKKQFQEAKAKINDGHFRESLPLLKSLDQKLFDKLQDYQSARRTPASVRNEFSGEVSGLQSRVREGIDTIKSQLRAEYQTQLADAEQFETNRQYIQAREIYDRIIRSEPAFDEAIESRNKLYSKILTEAKTVYQESLIYESVGDLDNAAEGYQKTRDLLTNVRDPLAVEYYRRSANKLRRLQK
ncbi:MAG: FHA domain-containing protein [Bdellovibrionales bacterium]|nr:FHA domain-containing protein [Bdellovibrionales bacterium]